MRILSREHDYYDNLMKLGTDDRCLYIRDTQKIDYYNRETKKYTPPTDLFSFYSKDLSVHFNEGEISDTINLSSVFFVLFCGRLIPVLWLKYANNLQDGFQENFKFCYSSDNVSEFIQTFGDKTLNKDFFSPKPFKRNNRHFSINRFNFKSVEMFFSERRISEPTESTIAAHHKLGVPVVLLCRGAYILNPILKYIEFYQIFDSYSAYQEISMFISGVLGGASPPIVQIDDSTRLQKKGFDPRTSFRNCK